MTFKRFMLAAALFVCWASPGFAASINPAYFQQTITIPLGSPETIVLADMNRDGKLDIISAGRTHLTSIERRAWILLGQGDGNFVVRTNFLLPPAYFVTSIVVGDWNSDGNPDLAFAVTVNPTSSTTRGLATFLGSQDGTLRAADQEALPSISSAVAGDFNRDNRPDLVACSVGALVFLRGNGAGTFQPSAPFGTNYYSFVHVVDFNTDGNLDLIAIGYQTLSDGGTQSIFSLFEGRGDGSFLLKQSYPVSPPLSAMSQFRPAYPATSTIADFNDDQIADVVVVSPLDGLTSVFPGKKDGTFSGPTINGVFAFARPFTARIEAADVNCDGVIDLIVGHGLGVSVLVGVGDGTFRPEQRPFGYSAYDIFVGDCNGDGKIDIVSANTFSPVLSLTIHISACEFRPELSFRRTEGGLLLGWPKAIGAFRLESTASLVAPKWNVIANGLTEGPNGRWETLIPSINAQRFFRIAK